MTLADKTLGAIFLTISALAFTYYTVWTLVLPFVDKGHPFRAFFPDHYYAVAIPLTLLVVGISGITALIGLVMVKSSKSKKSATPTTTKTKTKNTTERKKTK